MTPEQEKVALLKSLERNGAPIPQSLVREVRHIARRCTEAYASKTPWPYGPPIKAGASQ